MIDEAALVSVIIPVLNSEKYLSTAIKSILIQSYRNIELIIIDDSKNEICFEIINEFTDSRIKYFKGPKKNLSAALNLGIECSKGQYIARMDSDDIAEADRILLQIQALKKNDWQICGTWIKKFGSDSRVYTNPSSSYEIRYSMLFTCAIAHPTVLAEASLFHKYKYNIQSCVEDYDLWTRMLKDNVLFGNLPIALLKYRRHSDAATAFSSQRQLQELERIAIDYTNSLLDYNSAFPFTQLSCGMAESYSLIEIESLCDFIFGLVQKKYVSQAMLAKMIPAYLRKSKSMNIGVWILYLKLLRKYKLPIVSVELFYMAFLSIFMLNRHNKFYGPVRNIISKIMVNIIKH